MNYKFGILGSSYAAVIMLTSSALAEEVIAKKPSADHPAAASEAHPAKLGRTSKTSLLMGKDVKNLQGEKLGDVTDIIVDLAAGRVVAVVISSGGFLGLGDELSIVPPAVLGWAHGSNHLQLDASKATLSAAPHFKSSEWPDLSNDGYVTSVYSAYKMEPFSHQTAADNTARNAPDRNGAKPTAFDQGNSKEDVNITAQIRKGIMAKEGLSVSAQNVKIVTNNGHVTLRGPVNNAEEKTLICDLAIKAVGKEHVDDQLEVK